MNNEQFRKLLAANTAKSDAKNNGATPSSSSGVSLGSRQRASIPMTPRSLGGNVDFARQLAERNQARNPKKFRSSAPKGVKLGSAYTDRSKLRDEKEALDDREARIKALEESLKKEEIDQATFERLRNEIAGGDLSTTHLVKGLDFKLLERVKKGENVYDTASSERPTDEDAASAPDVEDELDQLEEREVTAIEKEKKEKKGQLSTVALAPGKKRTRDQILAEYKAAREAAKAQAEPTLGDRFKKIGATQKAGSRIERDSKGREVLIIVDEDGHEKRKVRRTQADIEEARKEFIPDKNAKPLGMEVPDMYKKPEAPEEDEDIDIFADAGDDYNPLAALEGASETDSDDDEPKKKPEGQKGGDAAAMPPPPPKEKPQGPKNYFQDSKTGLISSEAAKAPSWSDPSIQAAIKKAAAIKSIAKDDDEDDPEARAKAERRRQMLQAVDRDAEDMDMGFGTSRFEDEEDVDDSKIKLSRWGEDDDDGDGRSGGGKGKRKRGPKKRKGDVNSAADVLKVLERRKADSKSR